MSDQVTEESIAIDSMSKPEKDIVTISSEEYEKLLSDSKKLPDMISREDFERRLAEAESNFSLKLENKLKDRQKPMLSRILNFCRALKRPVSNTKLLRLLHPV